MTSILKWLRFVSDPSRARILLLLEKEELNVAELQEILSMGQSRLSMHLSQMKQAELVEDRRTGKNILYRLHSDVARETKLVEVLVAASKEIPEAVQDSAALALVLNKRQDKMRAYFDELAGKFGKHYVPGRSWKALAEAFLELLPPMRIVDIGAGEGTVSQLLARNAEHVIAVDNSEKMVQFGTDLALRHNVRNLEYRLGDLEKLPVEDGSVDLALFSQSLHHAPHPQKAVDEARRVLRPGGRIVILDLLRHHFEEAREMYADFWLGFAEVELRSMLEEARFDGIRTAIVFKEPEAPHFETILAVGRK